MNLVENLLKEHSKRHTILIANYIGNSGQRFNLLIKIALSNKPVISQRAAWVLAVCNDRNPHLVCCFLPDLIRMLEKEVHPGVKRNILKILQNHQIPVTQEGKLFDILFKIIQSKDEPVAIKVFSLNNILKLVIKYPDLKTEFVALIKMYYPHAGAAFRSRAVKILQLYK